MSQNLKELIEQATPLPWGMLPSFAEHNRGNPDAEHSLALHAVNMLPKLVEALTRLDDNSDLLGCQCGETLISDKCQCDGCFARAVLFEANNPEVSK